MLADVADLDPSLAGAFIVMLVAVVAVIKTFDKRLKIQNHGIKIHNEGIEIQNKILLQKLEEISTNTEQTANTLNHRKPHDPTVKTQTDRSVELSKQALEKLESIEDRANDASEKAEKAQLSASNAEKVVCEMRQEVVEIKGMMSVLFRHMGLMGKRKDDPVIATDFDSEI